MARSFLLWQWCHGRKERNKAPERKQPMPIKEAIKQQLWCIREELDRIEKKLSEDNKQVFTESLTVLSLAKSLSEMGRDDMEGKTTW